MTNQYISRYNAGDTQFRRTDPWAEVPFEDPEPKVWVQIVWTTVVVCVVFALGVFIALASV